MDKARFLKWYRLVFGLLGFSAIITEIATLVERGYFVLTNFFSFFTIESNILAILILLLYGSMTRVSQKTHRYVQLVRGGVVLYMLMTGIIFALLLAGLEGVTLTAVPWDNTVLHYIMPIVILADWLMDTPKVNISLKQAWVWLIFPIGYVLYTLARGIIVDWYPYPFLDPRSHGYLPVIITSVLLATGIVIVSWALCLTTRSKHKKQDQGSF